MTNPGEITGVSYLRTDQQTAGWVLLDRIEPGAPLDGTVTK